MTTSTAAFRWSDTLKIGVPLVDSQHRQYFDRVNQALLHAGAGGAPETFLEALKFVRGYTVLHFDSEQDIMRFHEYPDFNAHLAQHQYFSQRLDALADEFQETGLSSELENALFALLVDWFVNHIRRVDARLGEFLEGKIAKIG